MKTRIVGFILFLFIQYSVLGQSASANYETQTGTLGSTYSWINCSGGLPIFDDVNGNGNGVGFGDDVVASIPWPFNFRFYDNNYTTSNFLSIVSNGFIRLNGSGVISATTATNYNLTSTATNLGQIIAMAVYDGNLSDPGSWVRYLVTGSTPNRVLTIEYNNLEIPWNGYSYADVQVSFYETSNKIVLKFGSDNISYTNGIDMGIHSGVSGYFHKWQEVRSGANNSWIEYTPPNVEISDNQGAPISFFSTLKDAFDEINNGTYTSDIVIKIHNSTYEYASAILNPSTPGNPYSRVSIYPTKTGLSITGNLPGPLIDLNGADKVTIDGRVNATGSTKSLNIVNLSTSSTNNTSTIRFINGAINNTVKYCSIKGAETSSEGAIILFQTTTFSGNSGNLIDRNNITGSTATNRPENVIYSLGTN